MKTLMPDLSYELKHAGIVCGVDEAGRGPLAGPVVAAAVILNRECIPKFIDDSKRLTRKKREALVLELKEKSIWAIGMASSKEIDTLNILQASKLAMSRAVEALAQKPAVALIDGNQPPDLCCETVCIIKGDTLSLSIAAASIIAKVTRDALMIELGMKYPHYGFERHAGYGTQCHLEALAKHGICPEHRMSFRPVREALAIREAA